METFNILWRFCKVYRGWPQEIRSESICVCHSHRSKRWVSWFQNYMSWHIFLNTSKKLCAGRTPPLWTMSSWTPGEVSSRTTPSQTKHIWTQVWIPWIHCAHNGCGTNCYQRYVATRIFSAKLCHNEDKPLQHTNTLQANQTFKQKTCCILEESAFRWPCWHRSMSSCSFVRVHGRSTFPPHSGALIEAGQTLPMGCLFQFTSLSQKLCSCASALFPWTRNDSLLLQFLAIVLSAPICVLSERIRGCPVSWCKF